MKVKAGNTVRANLFKEWLLEKLKTEVYIDTDLFPDFPGKKEYLNNLLSKGTIAPINTDDELNQRDLELKRKAEKEKWAQKLEERRRLNETLEEKMARAEERLKRQK